MPSADAHFLSLTQRRIASFAVTLLAFLGSAALLIGAFYVFGQLVSFFSGVIWPLAVAGVLALILRPIVEVLEARLKLRRPIAVVVLYGVFALLVAGVLVLLLPPLIDQIGDFIAYVPAFRDNAASYLQQHYPQWVDLGKRQLANPTIRQIFDTLLVEARALLAHALPSVRAAGVGVLGVFGFITHVAIIPVYLFFFLLARGDAAKRLPDHLSFLQSGLRDDLVFLAREFVAIVESFFRGQLLIGLVMGVLLAFGFTIVGLKFGLFIGLALGLLNIVPYLGTILGTHGARQGSQIGKRTGTDQIAAHA